MWIKPFPWERAIIHPKLVKLEPLQVKTVVQYHQSKSQGTDHEQKSLYREGSRVGDDSIFHCIIANRKRLFHKSWVISITWNPSVYKQVITAKNHTGFSIVLTSSRAQVLGMLKSCRKLCIVCCRLETSRRTTVYAGVTNTPWCLQ